MIRISISTREEVQADSVLLHIIACINCTLALAGRISSHVIGLPTPHHSLSETTINSDKERKARTSS